MLTTAGKNQMLDNWGGGYLSAHTAFPGDSGASEVTYHTAGTRANGTFASASGGSKALSSTASLNIPSGVTVQVADDRVQVKGPKGQLSVAILTGTTVLAAAANSP